jgi:hypothetical protein
MVMKFIFSKAGLALILVAFISVWLGGGILNQAFQNSSNTQQKSDALIPQPQNDPKDTTPPLVQWIIETSQPVAKELRSSINTWWEGQKVILANQLIEWLTQQQQSIASGIQTQLNEMIKNALKVNSTTPQ